MEIKRTIEVLGNGKLYLTVGIECTRDDFEDIPERLNIEITEIEKEINQICGFEPIIDNHSNSQ